MNNFVPQKEFEEFNPDDFGFTIDIGELTRSKVKGRDYYCMQQKKNNQKALYISLSEETSAIAKAFSDDKGRVGIRFNNRGDCVLGDFAPRRKLSPSNKGIEKRHNISVNGGTDHILKCVGNDFKHAYLEALPYASGNAVLLRMTSEVD